MISFENVSKVFSTGIGQDVVVLDKVTVDLPSDCRLAILGLRESGKTTLINLLAGLSDVGNGTITRYSRLSFPIGYLFQNLASSPARQQVRFIAETYGSDPEEVQAFVASLPGMADVLDTPLNLLPRQKRLYFAYAVGFATPFDTYLLDERVGAGDEFSQSICRKLFEERSRSSGTILATRHFRLALELADAGAVLHNGQLHFYPTIKEATEIYYDLLRSKEGEKNVRT